MFPDVWPLATRRKRRDGTFRMPWLRTSRPCVRSASRFRSRTRRSITWKSPHRDLVLGGPYCGFKPFFPLATSAVHRRCFVAVADCCPSGGDRPGKWGTTMGDSAAPDFSLHLDPVVQCLCCCASPPAPEFPKLICLERPSKSGNRLTWLIL